MNFKKHIPNLLTLGNLFCGTIATIFAVEGDFVLAGLFVLLGILFDFFDGFAARLLHVSGELGKQLDSLADMVTSGVVPGIIVYKLLIENSSGLHDFNEHNYLPYLGLILTLGACYRLAKFNIDTRQSDSFIGLPTPAMSLFIISLPLIQEYSTIEVAQNLIGNNYFLIAITVLLTYLMNAELPLFSLKFKEYSIKNNLVKYLFLVVSLLMIIFLQYISIPLIIIFYVVLSVVSNYRKKELI
ncbi:CDP-alcohol phosphatidyltransferase family protein [Polaribacter sp. Z014]|uniref:CDP-alcohol phosphatidyltransferase family protein n=1 Tax=unclassified Polaribacter TaxID=196858 RepID=UPI00193B6DC1|nr:MULTISPECIES: CDP-alcohol phosphatidyltransferase family protein [unclassified Polaribacter]MCL7764229.1 CDP-alcohol phosphatidyltransferase family protein [Polaribacter sp. Z014]QVY65810.1 CDP-alcohol phosphatidyltransferase family protein [Polaribacter sp. Q13]